jgi:hypothetical protein
VIIATYNDHVRLLSPEPWLVGTTKDYSGLGADIVMESITLKFRLVSIPLKSGAFEAESCVSPFNKCGHDFLSKTPPVRAFLEPKAEFRPNRIRVFR